MTSTPPPPTTPKTDNDVDDDNLYDVLIVGAGISGISAAYHVQTHTPWARYKILERRAQLGGTWDLFDYPGIRSDSDMYTFGFSFRPWQHPDSKVIAPKEDILSYLKETAAAFGIDQHIEYGVHMHTADWNSEQALWTGSGTRHNNNHNNDDGSTSETVTYRARFVFLCVGYYNYDKGYTPDFAGLDAFQGPIIHPQHWPAKDSPKAVDYTNKHVVVIGSGATAVTLIPALTQGPNAARHVTMVQRSPTYMVARPAQMTRLPRIIAAVLGHYAARWFYILLGMFMYTFCQVFPKLAKKRLIEFVQERVGDEVFDEKDFTPRYKPWDQRLCLCPDGDFFQALKSGKASIVTDHIVQFTKTGLLLKDTGELQADVIVTATGLQMLFGGGIQCTVDKTPLDIPSKFLYKGFMLNDVPNVFVAAGYTNASWTLKVDLTNKAACRLIDYMHQTGQRYCQPETNPQGSVFQKDLPAVPLLDLTSSYVQRSLADLPKQSTFLPWRLYQNYLYDKFVLEYTSLQDPYMKFYK